MPIALVDRVQRPPRRFVGMTIRARIRSAHLHRQVGTRNADTVIATRVDDHVGARRHMTLDAARARRSDLVEVMCRRVVLRRRMALHANVVAIGAKPRAVRLVTITASDAGVEHPALDERTVLVVLLFYL